MILVRPIATPKCCSVCVYLRERGIKKQYYMQNSWTTWRNFWPPEISRKGVPYEDLLRTLLYHTVVMCLVFQSRLWRSPRMPRGVSSSGIRTPDRGRNSRWNGRDWFRIGISEYRGISEAPFVMICVRLICTVMPKSRPHSLTLTHVLCTI